MSLSGYDSWLEKPYRDRDAADARFERHIETCERCAALERDRHGEECRDCGHDWHAGPCGHVDAEPLGGWQGAMGAGEPCECELPDILSDNLIADLQNKCADDAEASAYADYCDRLCDEARDRELGLNWPESAD